MLCGPNLQGSAIMSEAGRFILPLLKQGGPVSLTLYTGIPETNFYMFSYHLVPLLLFYIS